MTTKNIFAIIGSTRANSSSLYLIEELKGMASGIFDLTIFEGISNLPHFNSDLDKAVPPKQVKAFRHNIESADGVIICTPEYVFSLPGSLKNAIEWCVSTTLFSQKPTGLITASTAGQKAHEQLELIMQTVGAKFNEKTTLLISGIKAKLDDKGKITDLETKQHLETFINDFNELLRLQ